MGSCICKYVEMNKQEVSIVVNSEEDSKCDISSSSLEIGGQELEDWQRFRLGNSKSFNESLGMLSTLLQSERKISVYSKAGSVAGSFVVNARNS
jgi:hypothetical protein